MVLLLFASRGKPKRLRRRRRRHNNNNHHRHRGYQSPIRSRTRCTDFDPSPDPRCTRAANDRVPLRVSPLDIHSPAGPFVFLLKRFLLPILNVALLRDVAREGRIPNGRVMIVVAINTKGILPNIHEKRVVDKIILEYT